MKRQATAPSIADLSLPLSGHFFLLPKALTSAAVKSLFKAILAESADGRAVASVVRTDHDTNGLKYVCSWLCFRRPPHAPSFMPLSSLREINYGFALLLEVAGLLVVVKRGANIDEEWIDERCNPVNSRALTRVFSDEAAYEKMSLRRMSISPNELRSCAYEADDLATTIPVLGLGRSIPRFIRLVHPKEGTVSVTPGTSRLNKSGTKHDVNSLAAEVAKLAPQLKTANPSLFLDSFPVPTGFGTLTTSPTGILFDLSQLVAGSEIDGRRVVLRKAKREDKDVTNEVLEDLRTIKALTPRRAEWVFKGNGYCAGSLKKTKRTFRAKIKVSQNLILKHSDGTEEEFRKWVGQLRDFSVSFAEPEFFFTQGELYRAASFAKEIETVAQVMEPHSGLANVTNEKGVWNKNTKNYNYTASSTRFENGSIFRFIEDQLCATEEHLLCSDLDDEWADYLALSGGRLSFIHCKHDKETVGAAPFQEVIGQAIKNLGRVQISSLELMNKITALEAQRHWKPSSMILRYRGIGGMAAAAKTHIADFQPRREVVLTVTALSRARFESARNETPLKPHFVQFIWIVSGFIHTCREKGASPRIVCRP